MKSLSNKSTDPIKLLIAFKACKKLEHERREPMSSPASSKKIYKISFGDNNIQTKKHHFLKEYDIMIIKDYW